MNEACARWIVLADREAVDEPLSDSERAFMDRHASTCRACGMEAAFFVELGDERAAGADEAPQKAVDRVLLALRGAAPDENRKRPTVRPPKRPRVSHAVRRLFAGLAAAAAFGLLLSFLGTSKPSLPPAPATARVFLTQFSGASDGTRQTVGELGRGAVVRTTSGSACLRLEPGVSACLGENSQLSVAETLLEKRELELVRGRVVVSLEKQPADASFSVRTRHGSVTATGTVFSVEIVGDSTLVRVEEGSVVTRHAGRAPQVVRVNQRLVLGDESARVLPREEAERDRTLIQKGSFRSGGTVATLEVPSGAKAEPANDGGPGAAGPAVPSAASHEEPPPSSPIAPFPSLPSTGASSAEFPDHAPDTRSASQLISVARNLRSQGRLREAADAYLLLESRYPASAEAIASHVSLGDVRLAMGDPASALGSFDAYLRVGGPLTQEARYGRIRALAELGRSVDAERATEEFLRLYPNSVQAHSLRKPR